MQINDELAKERAARLAAEAALATAQTELLCERTTRKALETQLEAAGHTITVQADRLDTLERLAQPKAPAGARTGGGRGLRRFTR